MTSHEPVVFLKLGVKGHISGGQMTDSSVFSETFNLCRSQQNEGQWKRRHSQPDVWLKQHETLQSGALDSKEITTNWIIIYFLKLATATHKATDSLHIHFEIRQNQSNTWKIYIFLSISI